MNQWIYLTVGGIAGTLGRYILSGLVYQRMGTNFPYGTLVVNVLGCLIVGFLDVIFEEKFLLAPNMRLLLMVGFCGAFTTFSTFVLETSNLIKDGQTWLALGNVLVSVVIGFMAFRLGMFLGEII